MTDPVLKTFDFSNLPCIGHVDTSVLPMFFPVTDHDFDEDFVQQLDQLADQNDVLIDLLGSPEEDNFLNSLLAQPTADGCQLQQGRRSPLPASLPGFGPSQQHQCTSAFDDTNGFASPSKGSAISGDATQACHTQLAHAGSSTEQHSRRHPIALDNSIAGMGLGQEAASAEAAAPLSTGVLTFGSPDASPLLRDMQGLEDYSRLVDGSSSCGASSWHARGACGPILGLNGVVPEALPMLPLPTTSMPWDLPAALATSPLALLLPEPAPNATSRGIEPLLGAVSPPMEGASPSSFAAAGGLQSMLAWGAANPTLLPPDASQTQTHQQQLQAAYKMGVSAAVLGQMPCLNPLPSAPVPLPPRPLSVANSSGPRLQLPHSADALAPRLDTQQRLDSCGSCDLQATCDAPTLRLSKRPCVPRTSRHSHSPSSSPPKVKLQAQAYEAPRLADPMLGSAYCSDDMLPPAHVVLGAGYRIRDLSCQGSVSLQLAERCWSDASSKHSREDDESPPAQQQPGGRQQVADDDEDGDCDEDGDAEGEEDDVPCGSGPCDLLLLMHCNPPRREITRAVLKEVYDLPINEAARKLGVGVTVLKKYCRKYQIPRWPYRKLKSMEKLIESVQEYASQDPEMTQTVLAELMSFKNMIYEDPSIDLEARIKKLRQANFKLEYKQRQCKRPAAPRKGLRKVPRAFDE